ncbi:MAG: hypothetical protein AAF687_12395 [Pseudomonadota bacterium]
MNEIQPPSQTEQIAKRRFLIMGATRIGALVALLVGLAIARTVIDAPYWLGVVLAIGGMLAFFFGPPLLAKRWKAGDRERRE